MNDNKQKRQNERIKRMQAAAEAGDAAAMVSLGHYYEYCQNEEIQDFCKASYWYKKAAEAGNAEGMRELALFYISGIEIEADAAKAAYWYGKAADLGDALAKRNLALCYRDGEGVERDINKSLTLFREAAGGSDIKTVQRACNEIADIYFNGNGIAPDGGLAEKWYRLAARLYDENGMYGLARCAANKNDWLLCAYWLNKATLQYHSDPDGLGNKCREFIPFYAEDILEDSAFYHSSFDNTACNLGDIFSKAGHIEEAADYWEYEEPSGDIEVKENLEKVRAQRNRLANDNAQFAYDNGCYMAAKRFWEDAAKRGDIIAKTNLQNLITG